MPTRAAVTPSGHETTTWSLRTGFSDTPTAAATVSTCKTPVESVAKPTASTHHANAPVATKRTRARGVPLAAGRSTRTGYRAGPSPATADTALHVAPPSADDCTRPRV